MKHPEFFEELVEVAEEALTRVEVNGPANPDIPEMLEMNKAQAPIVAAIVESYAYRRLLDIHKHLYGIRDEDE